RCPADWTLLEVGLGGRLDATNVVDAPRLTVITPVSMDHQQYLGDTLATIAGEKAGILKPGVPVIVAPQLPDAQQVIERRAAELGAPLRLAGRDFTIRETDGGLVFEDEAGALTLPRPALPGHHQIENAGVAIAALRAIVAGDAAAAMERVEWPARLQRLTRGPLAEAMPPDADLWLDGGHNPAAGAAIAAHFAGRGPLYVIAGMLETKEAADFARPFAPLVAAARTVTIPDTPASLTAAALAARFSEAGIDVKPAVDVQQALASFGALPPGAQVLICGSLYLAGQVLARHG
ncbi:MAG: bifunctional folylpolyglutamate synthase/dihydrofolate synthase, partial [Pseudomonadota bacterium]